MSRFIFCLQVVGATTAFMLRDWTRIPNTVLDNFKSSGFGIHNMYSFIQSIILVFGASVSVFQWVTQLRNWTNRDQLSDTATPTFCLQNAQDAACYIMPSLLLLTTKMGISCNRGFKVISNICTSWLESDHLCDRSSHSEEDRGRQAILALPPCLLYVRSRVTLLVVQLNLNSMVYLY